jgi:hypothetical protein
VLQITREFVKPGKAGMVHDKAESAFVDAMARAKWPTHYIGMTSLSGKSRALYLTSYESFDAWQKDTEAVSKNTTLSVALERAAVADGELLDSMDQGVFYFREEISLHPRADLSQMRFMALVLFHVRPGKEKQWTEVVNMAKAGYEKGVPGAHWGMFQQLYGGDSGTYLLLISHKTLAEIDKGFAEDKQFIRRCDLCHPRIMNRNQETVRAVIGKLVTAALESFVFALPHAKAIVGLSAPIFQVMNDNLAFGTITFYALQDDFTLTSLILAWAMPVLVSTSHENAVLLTAFC